MAPAACGGWSGGMEVEGKEGEWDGGLAGLENGMVKAGEMGSVGGREKWD